MKTNMMKFKETVLKMCKDLGISEEDFLIYTGDDGDKQDFKNVNELWKNKYIFCSQTVLYGIDYNHINTHHVIGLYFADGRVDMAADSVLQQLARVRHPFNKVYSSRNDVKYEYEEVIHKGFTQYIPVTKELGKMNNSVR